MNVQWPNTISDISGVTGQAIIGAIDTEHLTRDPELERVHLLIDDRHHVAQHLGRICPQVVTCASSDFPACLADCAA